MESDHSYDFPLSGILTERRMSDVLRAAGIPPTVQRLAIAQVLLAAPVHLTARQVLAQARGVMPEISRATVYNTLKLFGERKLVREIVVDAERVIFDSNTAPHSHFYDVGTGELSDVPDGEINIVGQDKLPPGTKLEGIEVVLRIRRNWN